MTLPTRSNHQRQQCYMRLRSLSLVVTPNLNQCMALDHLSDGMRKFLNEQKIINTSGKGKVVASRSDVMKHSSSGQVVNELKRYPVVRTHPETKEQALFVNEAHSLQFSMTLEESSSSRILFKHQIKSEFTCCFKWKKDRLRFGIIDVQCIIL